VGLIYQDRFGGPIAFVERGGRRYAMRTTFLTFPDGTGVRISGISDVVAHVRHCLEIAIGHRLDRFRGAALESLARNGQRLRSRDRVPSSRAPTGARGGGQTDRG